MEGGRPILKPLTDVKNILCAASCPAKNVIVPKIIVQAAIIEKRLTSVFENWIRCWNGEDHFGWSRCWSFWLLLLLLLLLKLPLMTKLNRSGRCRQSASSKVLENNVLKNSFGRPNPGADVTNKHNYACTNFYKQEKCQKFFKMGPPQPLFRLFWIFSSKQYNFSNKSMWKMSCPSS